MPIDELDIVASEGALDSDAEILPEHPPNRHWHIVLLEWVLVLGGGLVGTLVRAAISLRLGARYDHGFPWDILIINVVGAGMIGLFAGWRDPDNRQHELLWLAGATGFLGAFTTFSSFALGIVTLAATGHSLLGALYLVGSVLCGFAAVEGGLWVGNRVRMRR